MGQASSDHTQVLGAPGPSTRPPPSTEMGLVGAPIVGWPRQPRSKLRRKNLAWKHHADQASQHPPRVLAQALPCTLSDNSRAGLLCQP